MSASDFIQHWRSVTGCSLVEAKAVYDKAFAKTDADKIAAAIDRHTRAMCETMEHVGKLQAMATLLGARGQTFNGYLTIEAEVPAMWLATEPKEGK